MLSHLYRTASDFEQRHGVTPNLLYLNYSHFEQLQRALAGLRDRAALLQRLDMALVLQQDVAHPRVAWSQRRAPRMQHARRGAHHQPSIHNGVGHGQPRRDPL